MGDRAERETREGAAESGGPSEPAGGEHAASEPSAFEHAASERAFLAPDDLRLFDERYRWVLLHALRWLRDVPAVDLDDPEQLDAAYGFLSAFVQQAVQKRALVVRLDAMKVAAIAESSSARSTVEDILVNWLAAQ